MAIFRQAISLSRVSVVVSFPPVLIFCTFPWLVLFVTSPTTMPVPPRSSNGCHTCRKRKVKCDENKPQCNACLRLGRLCSWVREWKFRDLNALVADEFHVLSADEDQERYSPVLANAMVKIQWSENQSSNSYMTETTQSHSPVDLSLIHI